MANDLEFTPNEGTPIPDPGTAVQDPAEARASADGWRPRDEYTGDPADWVDAKTFNVKGELMSRITAQGKKLAQLETDNNQLNKMVKHTSAVTRQVAEKARAEAIRELRAEKAEAMHVGDHERVMDIDDAFATIKAQEMADAAVAAPETQQPVADRGNWTPQQNAWYDMVTTTDWLQDPMKNHTALKLADDILNETPNIPVGEFIGKLNDLGRQLNGGVGRLTPSGPDDGKGRAPKVPSKTGKFTGADLDEMETAMGKEFVSSGAAGIESLDAYAMILGKGGNLQKQQG